MLKRLFCIMLSFILLLSACGGASGGAVSEDSVSIAVSSSPSPSPSVSPSVAPSPLPSPEPSPVSYEYLWNGLSFTFPSDWEAQFDPDAESSAKLQRIVVSTDAEKPYLTLQYRNDQGYGYMMNDSWIEKTISNLVTSLQSTEHSDFTRCTLAGYDAARFSMDGKLENGQTAKIDNVMFVDSALAFCIISMVVPDNSQSTYADEFQQILDTLVLKEEMVSLLGQHEKAVETLKAMYDGLDGVHLQTDNITVLSHAKTGAIDFRLTYDASVYSVYSFQDLVLEAIDNIHSVTSDFTPSFNAVTITIEDGDGGIEWNNSSDDLTLGTLTDKYTGKTEYKIAPDQINEWFGSEEYANKATLGEANALSRARSYLNYTAFSRQGLIEQLEFEGYSNSEATYAVDHCDADWNEQAAKKAQQYLDFTSFSRQGLIDQLEFEGFTPEQAEYGVNAVGY